MDKRKPKQTIPRGLKTVHQAATLLKLQPETVYRYFHRGLLHKTLIGRAVFVAEQEIKRFAKRRKPKGNPTFVRRAKKR